MIRKKYIKNLIEEKIIAGFGDILYHSSLKSVMVEINIKSELKNNISGRILSSGFEKIEDEKYVNQKYVKTGFQNIFFILQSQPHYLFF